MAAPNIVNVTSIYGKTVTGTLNTSTSTSYLTCGTNKVIKVNTILIANSDGTNDATVTCFFYDSSAGQSRYIARTITVPADSTLVLISKDTSLYLEESDQIRAGASANSDLDIIISYEELDDA